MAKAKDVARYILQRREDTGHKTSTFALQKLLYYCQSWMLVAKDHSLFEDEIKAWNNGPVVTTIFHYCKGHRWIYPREIPDAEPNNLNEDERTLVDKILTQYDKVPDDDLGDVLARMTHEEQPWLDASKSESRLIDKQDMLDYYSCVQADDTISHASEVPDLTDFADSIYVSVSDKDPEWVKNLFLVKS